MSINIIVGVAMNITYSYTPVQLQPSIEGL